MVRKRKGELIVVLAMFMFISFAMTTILTSGHTRRIVAIRKAQTAGMADTCEAVVEMCSDYFVRDFQNKMASITIASGGYIGYTGDDNARREREYDIFDTALFLFQNDPSNGLKLEDGEGTAWVYKVQSPIAVIADSGITDENALAYLNDLLQTAVVRITVEDSLSIIRDPGDDLTMTTGDTVRMSPVRYTVEFKRGITQYTREYEITNKSLYLSNSDPYAIVSVVDS